MLNGEKIIMKKRTRIILRVLGALFILVGFLMAVISMVKLSDLKLTRISDAALQNIMYTIYKSNKEEYQMFIIIGIILLVIGIVIEVIACIKRKRNTNIYSSINPDIYNNYYQPMNQGMEPKTRICTNCGNNIQYNSMFCDMCGMKINNTNEKNYNEL